MELKCFRTLWEVTTPWSQTLDELQRVGCCGVGARVPLTVAERRELADRLQTSGLEYIAIPFSGSGVLPAQYEMPEQHLACLQTRFVEASSLSPCFVNLLAGNDRWLLAQQVDFLGKAHELAVEFGLTCSFETHCATSLYDPWLTLEITQQPPQLCFTADISYWVVVGERLLDDPCDDFGTFIGRIQCVQARVGYDQGPQVPHPAAPEYQPALVFVKRFWQQVWHSQRQRGYPQATLTPGFDTDGYLHHLPFANVPVADLWSLNAQMAVHQQAHFQQFLTLTKQEPQL